MPPRLVLDAHTLRMMAIAFVLLAALSIHRLWLADSPDTMDVLVLNGERDGPINNLCFPTQVAPEYGPEDRSLAYAQSEWMVQFIISRYGYAAIEKLLDEFREGRTQEGACHQGNQAAGCLLRIVVAASAAPLRRRVRKTRGE